MKIIDLSNAFSSPLKDKDAPVKVALYFGVNVVFLISIFAMSFFVELAEGSNNEGIAGLISLLFCCAVIFGALIIALFNGWYNYEYTSAAIEKRETNAIWEKDFSESFKKSGKLMLVNLIYNIPVTLFYCCVVFFAYLILFGALIGSFGLAAGSGVSDDPSAIFAAFSGISVGILIYCCFIVLLVFLNLLYQVTIIMPAILNLVRTHTFSKSFDFGANWKFMRSNFNYFMQFLLVQLGLGLLAFVFYLLFYFLSVFIVGIPLLILLGIIVLYYQGFVYPTLSGDFYRKLRQIDKK